MGQIAAMNNSTGPPQDAHIREMYGLCLSWAALNVVDARDCDQAVRIMDPLIVSWSSHPNA